MHTGTYVYLCTLIICYANVTSCYVMYATSYFVRLRNLTSRYAKWFFLRYFTLFYVMLGHVMLSTLRYVTLRYIMLRHAMLFYVML